MVNPVRRLSLLISESYNAVFLDFSRTYPDEYEKMNHGVEHKIDFSANSSACDK